MPARTTGQKIRGLRTKRKMSQEDLARAADCSIWTISRIESGHQEPLARTLRRIAAALGTTGDRLGGEDG